jgi:hypothetical protein
MQPEQQNPYDFMLEEPQTTKQGFKFDASGKKQRILIVVVGVLLLLIIAFVLMSIIGNAGKKDQILLFKVAAAQQDLIGLTTLGVNNTRTSELISQSTTTGVVITGQNKETIAYIAGLKIKSSNKQIAGYVNSSYKNLLDEARKNGNYNDTYEALYSDRINLYSSLLSQTYSATGSQKLKDLMKKFTSQIDSLSNQDEPTS